MGSLSHRSFQYSTSNGQHTRSPSQGVLCRSRSSRATLAMTACGKDMPGCRQAWPQLLPLTVSPLGVSARRLPRGCRCAALSWYLTTAKAFAFCPSQTASQAAQQQRSACPSCTMCYSTSSDDSRTCNFCNAYAAAVLSFVLLASP